MPKMTAQEHQQSKEFREIRKAWGEKLLILGHYYVPDETIAWTDRQGDSLALARFASANEKCRAIVFCGVYFMAETADILANSPEKIAARGGVRIPVVMLDTDAGCPMADMAAPAQVEASWDYLGQLFDVEAEVMPITYVNSSAAIKAFCGKHDGAVCTSSNAKAVLKWALEQKKRVLFLPDQHLGRNTALALGVPEQEIVQWSRSYFKSVDDETLKQARVILWDGFCLVHHGMTLEMTKQTMAEHPGAKLWVHPECPHEVVELSSVAGSTSLLIQSMALTSSLDHVILGTESHLVNRLREENQSLGRAEVINLGREHICQNMAKNLRSKLFQVVAELNAGTPRNVVSVPEEIAADARKALRNMLRFG